MPANLNELKQHCKEEWNKFPVIKSYLLKVIDAGGGSCIILYNFLFFIALCSPAKMLFFMTVYLLWLIQNCTLRAAHFHSA